MPAASQISVCTLWEGDYHKGLAALANSLVKAGFKGRLWAGYRGHLPVWVGEANSGANQHSLQLTAEVEILFVQIETPLHFALYKPTWCLSVLEKYEPTTSGLYYFDPDIVVLAPWEFFEEWLSVGVAVCEDSHHPLNPSHPRWKLWRAYACGRNFTVHREADANLNSGLVGLHRTHAGFLKDWESLISHVCDDFGAGRQIRTATRADIFHIPDQDTFTIAACVSGHPIARIGPDGMAFGQGEWLTVHASEGVKPWRRTLWGSLLRFGIVPDRALRLYWNFAKGPAAAESRMKIGLQRAAIPLVAFLSRFYHRQK
jgi:hypothetical protein